MTLEKGDADNHDERPIRYSLALIVIVAVIICIDHVNKIVHVGPNNLLKNVKSRGIQTNNFYELKLSYEFTINFKYNLTMIKACLTNTY